ncbi:hypothetical protein ACFX43_04420 [Nocardioides sp. YIM B13467]|uniref:hypothetical protein n=1 Tax=Nocardioides sp. YIM B13467 TaxID=3366294 RepID=UPI003671E0DE
MAVIALTSASGSPGVSTTALGLAMEWPRPVLLLEADPTGGSSILAGYLRGHTQPGADLVDLMLSPLGPSDTLPQIAAPIPGTSISYVPGTRTHIQAAGLRDHWGALSSVLADLDATGQDVIIDAGRLGLVGSAEPLLIAADLTLLVVRTDLPALVAARSWAESVTRAGVGWRWPGLLLVGEGMPYTSREVSRLLGLAVVGEIADDPLSAAVFHRGAPRPRHFATGSYARSLRAAAEELQAEIGRSRAAVATEAAR